MVIYFHNQKMHRKCLVKSIALFNHLLRNGFGIGCIIIYATGLTIKPNVSQMPAVVLGRIMNSVKSDLSFNLNI